MSDAPSTAKPAFRCGAASRVWALLALGCVGMALGVMGIGAENRVQFGPQFHSTVVSSLYFGLAIASGAALAMAGPPPALTRDQRLTGGIAVLALFGLASDVAVYLASVLLIVLAQQPTGFRSLLRRAPLVWLGHVSYSLYLVHVPVLVASMVLLHGTLPIWACLAVGIVASLPAAEAMHRLAEAPARDLARWAEWRLQASRPRASPPRRILDPLWAAEGGLPHPPDRPT